MSSSSIRFMSLVGLAALALSSVACMQAAPSEGNNDGSTAKKGGFFSPKADGESTDGNSDSNSNDSAEGASGTCEAACGHYLECKGAAMNTAQNRTTCTTNCKGLGLKSADLASFEQSDCATAIQMVEGNGQQQQQGTTSSSSGGSKGSECNGCVKDGDSCIWLSQSNWGSGPYSGAAATCESYCCQ